MSEKKQKEEEKKKTGGFTIDIRKIMEMYPKTIAINVLYRVEDGDVVNTGMELIEEPSVEEKPETIN